MKSAQLPDSNVITPGDAMVNPKLHGLSQEKLSTSASGGHDKATKPVARAVTARVAPAFLQPMIGARVKELLGCSGIFPPHAELTVQEAAGDAILIQCSWLLQDNPEQPDRRSTPVKIVIHADLADRFHNANPEMFKRLYEALVLEVARRMKRYRADHGLPYHRPPPPFEIQLGLGQVGGDGRRRKLQPA